MSQQIYIHPVNDYEETDGGKLCFLWSFLFGPFYFAFRGNWDWFMISICLGIITVGISPFIIPFFARKINRTHLLRKGFKQC